MHNILSYQNRKYKTKIAFYTNNKDTVQNSRFQKIQNKFQKGQKPNE